MELLSRFRERCVTAVSRSEGWHTLTAVPAWATTGLDLFYIQEIYVAASRWINRREVSNAVTSAGHVIFVDNYLQFFMK